MSFPYQNIAGREHKNKKNGDAEDLTSLLSFSPHQALQPSRDLVDDGTVEFDAFIHETS